MCFASVEGVPEVRGVAWHTAARTFEVIGFIDSKKLLVCLVDVIGEAAKVQNQYLLISTIVYLQRASPRAVQSVVSLSIEFAVFAQERLTNTQTCPMWT